MPITDTRKTILQIVNEARGKLGLPDAASLTADTHAKKALDYLNDIIDITTDYGDWQELLRTMLVTASTSVIQYVVSASAPIKNIHEVAFYGQIAALRYRTIDEMRRWQRTGGTGNPLNWTIIGVDQNTANPIMQVWPQPGASQNNLTFNILYYEKPPLYTTSDGSVIPPFPSRLLVNGLVAMLLLDESRGTQNIDFMTEFMKVYTPMMEEAYNRYNGDSGSDVLFGVQPSGYRRQ